MGLTWKISNETREAGYGWKKDERTGEDYVHPVTQTIVFATMSAGIGEITEKNVDEFFARMTISNKLHGIGIIEQGSNGEARPITWEEVKAHIGLETNVFPNESRAVWAKRMFVGGRDVDVSITSDFKRDYRRSEQRHHDAVGVAQAVSRTLAGE